jgi:hypothetical protein
MRSKRIFEPKSRIGSSLSTAQAEKFTPQISQNFVTINNTKFSDTVTETVTAIVVLKGLSFALLLILL